MAKKFNRRGFVTTSTYVGAGIAMGLPATGGTSGYQPFGQLEKTAYLNKSGNNQITSGLQWNQNDLTQVIVNRAKFEKGLKEVDVFYYRIGFSIAYRLPVAQRPKKQDMPVGIPSGYPWLTWLSWDLEDRWRTLNEAWRIDGDNEAGLLFQKEMASLDGWDLFVELNNQVSLVTAHVAASLSLALADKSGWDPALLSRTLRAAEDLVERDAWPWYEKNWGNTESFTPQKLHNIAVIGLVRSTQLARVISSPRAAVMEKKLAEVLSAWCHFRIGKEFHTEGTAYDGYLMDNFTEWIKGQPVREELLKEYREAFRSLANQWIDLTLPGRPDLHAPIGDVEPEMMFWITALIRLAGWYGWSDAAWLISRIPVENLPTAAISAAREHRALFKPQLASPIASPREHPNAITLRTGWSAGDLAALISVSRNKMSHLQSDGGHLVLGWQGRFWITDPGYQQYKAGEERNYTLGIEAHNCPVINGQAQKIPATKLLKVDIDQYGWQNTSLDLTPCYTGLPADALVRRDVWLATGEGKCIVVRDRFFSLSPGTEIRTHWLGDTNLAWSFVNGWVRLSNGSSSVWFGTIPDSLDPATLNRHPGSRGPLTLTHTSNLEKGAGVRWWVFWCDPDGNWLPPTIRPDGERMRISYQAHPGAGRSFGE